MLRGYARAGIPEYWVLDVNHGRLHVHREPNIDGYQTHLEIDRSGVAGPQAAPGWTIPLLDLLPKE